LVIGQKARSPILSLDDFEQVMREVPARARNGKPRRNTRRPVRLHDLRASMVSVALANHRPEEQIRRRTGHTSSALERYRRVAGTLKELNLGDWAPSTKPFPS
jgi:hypothetical protein